MKNRFEPGARPQKKPTAHHFKFWVGMAAFGLLGCHAYHRPVVNEKRNVLGERVAVQGPVASGATRLLADDIERTGLFNEVVFAETSGAPADWVAAPRPFQAKGGCPAIPLWSVLSLGIIPTVCREYAVQSFDLQNPNGSRKAKVDVEWAQTHVIGWGAAFMALSPRWTLGTPKPPHEDEAYGRYLAGKIMDLFRNSL